MGLGLTVDGIYLRNCRGSGQELFIHILLLDIAFSCVFGRLASRLLCIQPYRLQRSIHNRSQKGLDRFEFSREHGNVLRQIVDYLPRPLDLLRGPTPKPRTRWWTEASPIARGSSTADLLAV
jgi:hypothetical protein